MATDMRIKAISDFLTPMDYAVYLVRVGVFEIDSDGQIWRLGIMLKSGRIKPVARRRAENGTCRGYLRITLKPPNYSGTKTILAHRLVWVCTNGPIPDGLQINHKNLVRNDNRPSNLELLSGAENIQHSYANGRNKPWGSATEWRPGKPRITQEQIDRVLSLRREGLGAHRIGRLTGISRTHCERLFKKGGAQCLT